jgi:hypothetical protein
VRLELNERGARHEGRSVHQVQVTIINVPAGWYYSFVVA